MIESHCHWPRLTVRVLSSSATKLQVRFLIKQYLGGYYEENSLLDFDYEALRFAVFMAFKVAASRASYLCGLSV